MGRKSEDRRSEDGKSEDVAASGFSRRRFLKWSAATGAATTAVAALGNSALGATQISTENAQNGSPQSEWKSDRDQGIVGFTTSYSVLPGERVDFKIKTSVSNYKIRIYRLGYYGGAGARFLSEVSPSVPLPQTQPAPLTEASTGLVDCGNWNVSASWTVPTTAVSGVYLAKFVPVGDSVKSNHTVFVVRTNRASDILVQTSEATMHAYNRYGGNSLYYGSPVGRAYKVSYNRPFGDGIGRENDFLNAEYALVRFLERNGYDVAYCGGIDVLRSADVLTGRKIFISSGHDEYVTGPQREHVEQARAAGTHLIFMTGNEYFWKTRMEPSLDASTTPERTIVCYKETLDNKRLDPSGTWTGTWRDARFSPPADGGKPENALTGQLYRAILPVNNPDLAITVPAEFRSLRIWRNTAVAALAPGQTRTLAASTLGYEFDVDAENGYRPEGVIRLSSTIASAPQILQDSGGTYAAGTVEHNLTLYRHASGALVWGTGTVQWAYGLDANHEDDQPGVEDPVIQQATVNVLADMGVQPATLMAGLVGASKSTDTTPPTVTIAAPQSATVVPVGSPLTVSGTAIDSGGGVVAGIEVSVDGGQSWRRATGTSSWSFVFTPVTLGPITIKVRGVDDSCNIGQPATVSVQGGERQLPCSIWPPQTTPAVIDSKDNSALEAGVRFRADRDGFITGVRFYKCAANTGAHLGRLWTKDGLQLASAVFANETASGWQTVNVPPVAVNANTTYVASVWMPVGRYSTDSGYFTAAFDLPPLRALANGEDGANGVYRAGSSGFPTSTYGAANYWVDVVFSTDNNAAPTVVSHSPARDLAAVALSTTITATFSEAMKASSIVLTLSRPDGSRVPGTTGFDAASRTATFTPSGPLDPGGTYSAAVSQAQDSGGTAMAAPFPWQFTTTASAGGATVTLWDTSAIPARMETADTRAVELGMQFSCSQDASVTGLRFYKAPGSSGTHVGHLWSASGTLLATAAFTSETASGWQQVNLPSAVAITKNTTYVVSYYAPNGVYGASAGYFNTALVRSPLQAPASSSAGGNGVYRYGDSSFPTTSGSGANYWADVVVTLPSSTTALEVTSTQPTNKLFGVAAGSPIEATFNTSIAPGSLQFTVTGPGGNSVAGTPSYQSSSHTARFTPSTALSAGTEYRATVAAAAVSGQAMPTVSWTFTIETPAGGTPATLWNSAVVPAVPASSDSSAIELGVRFRSSSAGTILGVRFYKGPGNTGTHIGRLWTASGTLVASATFTNESYAGWQQVLFSQPVAITANTDYVASYYAPDGRYAVNASTFTGPLNRAPLTIPASTSTARNGLYQYGSGGFPTNSYNASNYWVDVVFADSDAPSVVSTSPASGSTQTPPSVVVDATFSEAVNPSTVVFTVRDATGAMVTGSQGYSSADNRATFTPSTALVPLATYTASIEAASDLQGNALPGPVSWTFTVAGASYLSIWDSSQVPSIPTTNDSGAVELGMRFRTSAAGTVVGVRFYRGGTTNAAPHRVSLWTNTGTLLASAVSTTETARGWQSVFFDSPVTLSVDTTYVVSYFASQGMYSTTAAFFNAGPVTSGPLTALANGTDGGNGLYRYAATSAFPNSTFNGTNYWVDVLFSGGMMMPSSPQGGVR